MIDNNLQCSNLSIRYTLAIVDGFLFLLKLLLTQCFA